MIPNLGSIAVALVDAVNARRTKPAPAKYGLAFFAGIVAGLCGLTVIALLLVGLWLTLQPLIGSANATFALAGVIALVGLIAIFAARKALQPAKPVEPPAPLISAQLLDETTKLMKDNKTAVLIAALLAGVMAGRNDR